MGSIVRHDPRLASRHMNHGQIGHVEHTSKSSIWCTSAQTIDLKRRKKQLATYIYIHTYIYIYIMWLTSKKRQQHNLQKQDVPHLHKSFRWSSCNWELALARSHWFTWKKHGSWWQNSENDLGMDQYQLIPFLGEWTSIYQLFWCSPGVQGFDTLPFPWKRLQSRCHGLSKALACTLGRLSWPSFCLKYFTGLYWTLASTDSHGTSKRNKYKYNLKLTRALVITTREKKENNALTRAWVYHHWRCGFGIRNEQNTCSILQCFFYR